MEWQPIETAPKDGTEILGFRESFVWCDKYAAIRFISDTNEWRHVDRAVFLNPTHWMPLPAPPAK